MVGYGIPAGYGIPSGYGNGSSVGYGNGSSVGYGNGSSVGYGNGNGSPVGYGNGDGSPVGYGNGSPTEYEDLGFRVNTGSRNSINWIDSFSSMGLPIVKINPSEYVLQFAPNTCNRPLAYSNSPNDNLGLHVVQNFKPFAFGLLTLFSLVIFIH
jgi:hypothetical protein